MPGKAAVKDPKREGLAKELSSLIPKLDAEGLAFLVEQAKVHLYNMRVDNLNQAAVQNEAAAKKPGNTRENAGVITIKGTASGSSFYLHYRNDDAMFSRDEMAHLVKMVNGPGTSLEIRERLFNWLDRERKDVFAVLPVKDKFDDRLKNFAAVIKKSFKLRDA